MTKKTRYFMAGSGAVVAAGLITGLVAYRGGGFQALSASTGRPSWPTCPPTRRSWPTPMSGRSWTPSCASGSRSPSRCPRRGQEEFQAQTGIDIERDIDYVVAAMVPGTTGTMGDKSGLIVARGRFDVVKLEGLAREHGGTVEEYSGKRLVSITNTTPATPAPRRHPDPPQRASQHDDRLPRARPRGLRRERRGQARHRRPDARPEHHQQQRDDGAGQRHRADQQRLGGRPARRADQPRAAARAGRQPGRARSSGSPRRPTSTAASPAPFAPKRATTQSAENLRDVVRGVLALGRLQAQSDPRLTVAAESLQLAGTGKTVSLSFTVPAELIDMAVSHAQTMAPKVLHH